MGIRSLLRLSLLSIFVSVYSQPTLDLSRIHSIQSSNPKELLDLTYVENLIVQSGFNNENLYEQPIIVKENTGGIFIWQYPNQFSKYLLFISQFKIHSYLEIGCRWGGTFIFTTEYLKAFNNPFEAFAVDVIDSPVVEYCDSNQGAHFLKFDSVSVSFKEYIMNRRFDLIFIDGDHSYEGVKNDYENCKGKGKIYVFHDIVNDECPGVKRFWSELKETEKSLYDFYEFTDQYAEIQTLSGKQYLGIGVAILQ